MSKFEFGIAERQGALQPYNRLYATVFDLDVVVMDNLHAHHREEIRAMLESVGAKLEYLPVYSPDFNPIEMMWSQIKSLVRKFRTKTVKALCKVIEVVVNLMDSGFLKNWFPKCCYCT